METVEIKPCISDYKAAKSKKYLISKDLSWIKDRIIVLEEKLLDLAAKENVK